MKSILLFALLLILPLQIFCAYEIGDVAENFTWLESDGGEPVERNLYDTINEGKIVFFFFGGLG